MKLSLIAVLLISSVTSQQETPVGQKALLGERKPDFSGTWGFAGVDAGTSISIVHRGKKLEISFEGFAMGRASATRNVYYIDGRPHTTTQTEYSKRRSTNKIENYKTSKFTSIVRWDGDKLVFGREDNRIEMGAFRERA